MRCQAETAVTFAARFSWWRFHVGAKKFALRRCVIAKARKSSPGALKTPQIRRFCAVLGEFFRGKAAGGAVLGEIFRADWRCAQVLLATRATTRT